jgi:uncharacterized protein
MGFTTTIDLAPVAHGLSLPLASVETVVRLLDAGNTVPFITRYRKDQTGGLDEEHIRNIESRVGKLRMLAERKQTILRSIDSQGKLTPELAKAINDADSTKRLEDLYLPFKPKKQTLATIARERQLEPLAAEILSASPSALDLDARAADFVDPDKQVHTPADALLGVGHILAEDFSERADLRDRLRKILKRTGKLVSTQIGSDDKDKRTGEVRLPVGSSAPDSHVPEAREPTVASEKALHNEPETASSGAGDSATEAPAPQSTPLGDGPPADSGASTLDLIKPVTSEMGMPVGTTSAHETDDPQQVALAPQDALHDAAEAAGDRPVPPHGEPSPQGLSGTPLGEAPPSAVEDSHEPDATTADGAGPLTPTDVAASAKPAKPAPPLAPALSRKEAARREREAKKARKEDRLSHEFRDYFNYQEQLTRIPPHRVLAINRGERAKILRVKIDSDAAEMARVAEELLVPADHPHGEFLRGCARDALSRLILPSLERDIRRELTDNAETHAVEVFAKNLRNLLLQPPVRGRRVLALDPGFKSGCKVAVLDEFGSLLDHTVVHLIGRAERKQEARTKLIELIRSHAVNVLAIGNGTACRETEEFVADILTTDLKDDGVAYVIVNEAGASVYSTSPLGREELPQYDATLRGAISIGRRLQDPLSELVKIDPANIGVGLYQHDVKAKHLRTSLDAVVESCVNYVGVDLNSASPALLRYVSGLNQLTARRLYDYRTTSGPFKRREQLKEVPGFGEATFVQAAGFLKITDGDQPLDTTWIHPESYPVAHKVLERVGRCEPDLTKKETAAELAEQVKSIDTKQLADELQVGQMTLGDIVAQFARPGRDPREDLPEPIFKRGVLKLDDLQPGMELSGSVLNVVDFGAFVDIGLHDSGLVHVSQLANRFVRDPHEVISVGDIVKVWVMEIDKTRRRVSLTMIPPGTKKPEPHFRRGKTERGAPGTSPAPREAAPQRQTADQQGGAPARPPRPARSPEGRPPRPQGGQGGGRTADQAGGRRSGPPPHLRPHGNRQGGGGRPAPQPYRPKAPPKPLPPITKKMIEGKEPMRTFGDLMQFIKVKQGDEPAAAGSEKTKGKTAPGQQAQHRSKPESSISAEAHPPATASVEPSQAPKSEGAASAESQLPTADPRPSAVPAAPVAEEVVVGAAPPHSDSPVADPQRSEPAVS